MQAVQVSSSIISTTYLSAFLKDKYQLAPNSKCKLLKAGINHTYLLNINEQKSIFRIYSYNWRTAHEIREELRLLMLLKDEGLSIAYPIADTNGNYIQEIDAPEGKRYGVLFSYASGKKLSLYSAAQHYHVGVLMAKMHQVMEGLKLDRVDYTVDILMINALNKIKPYIDQDSEEFQFLAQTQTQLVEAFQKLPRETMRYGAVHMDIWFDNLNITKEGAITIFDFDFCGNGFLAMDIAYYLLQVIFVERDDTIRQEKSENFLAGYESIIPISKLEKNAFPILGMSMYYFYLGIQCERYENWSNVFLNEHYVKRFISQIMKRYFEISGLEKIL